MAKRVNTIEGEYRSYEPPLGRAEAAQRRWIDNNKRGMINLNSNLANNPRSPQTGIVPATPVDTNRGLELVARSQIPQSQIEQVLKGQVTAISAIVTKFAEVFLASPKSTITDHNKRVDYYPSKTSLLQKLAGKNGPQLQTETEQHRTDKRPLRRASAFIEPSTLNNKFQFQSGPAFVVQSDQGSFTMTGPDGCYASHTTEIHLGGSSVTIEEY